MDSLLSNAQRCARKADSLVVYGLYDEALNELDKSIAYLNELKSSTTRYDNVQMLNVQIDSIDRKKRSVAIKRSESIKKKNRIDTILQNRKFNSIQAIKSNTNQYDNAPVLIEYCVGGGGGGAAADNLNGGYYLSDLADQQTIFVNGSKLDKNEKIIIEELSTTNAEFKKVNSFLVNEIEQLKKENDFLKVELIKLHMNDSLTSNESSICNDLNSTASSSSSSTQNSSTNNENSYTSSSSSGCESARSSPSVTSVTTTNSVLKSKCSNINSDNVRKLNSYVEQFNNEYKTPNNNNKKHSASSSSSSASSSSWSISSNSISHSNNKTSQLIKNSLNNDNTNIIDENKSIKIDLSRYINDDDDDDDDDDDENDYDRSFVNKNDTDDEFDLSNGLPPNEFTF